MRCIWLCFSFFGTIASLETDLLALLHFNASELLRNNDYVKFEQLLSALNDTDVKELMAHDNELGESLFYRMVCTPMPTLMSFQRESRHRLGQLFYFIYTYST